MTTGADQGDPLVVEDLSVCFGDTCALADVSLRVPAGTTLAVIGPNGSGKSTLLHAVAGLRAPTAGRITCDPGRTALVLQSTDVDRSLPITVRETVRMARYPHLGILGRFGPDDRRAVEAALERMELSDLASAQLHDLSGGQRQRVMVAQGLAQEADLILLDEPVTGVDVVSRQSILDAVDGERSAGRAVMVTTHNLEDARRCDQVLLLATTAVACGPPDEVLREEHLRQAFGGRVLRLPGGELVMDDPHHHAH